MHEKYVSPNDFFFCFIFPILLHTIYRTFAHTHIFQHKIFFLCSKKRKPTNSMNYYQSVREIIFFFFYFVLKKKLLLLFCDDNIFVVCLYNLKLKENCVLFLKRFILFECGWGVGFFSWNDTNLTQFVSLIYNILEYI